jgi:peptidyl-dipeptidase A
VTATGELDTLEARLAPLEAAANQSYWQLALDATSEHEAAATQAMVAHENALADPGLYAAATRLAAAPLEAIDHRRAQRLVLATRARQRPEALTRSIVELETTLEGRFGRYRATVDGQARSDNEIDQILLRSTDETQRREAWIAVRGVSAQVATDLRRLAGLRNEAAQRIGYRDHYALSLASEELDEAWLYGFLDQLDAALNEAWRDEKQRIDADTRRRLGLADTAPLMPWHYADPLLDAVTTVDAVAIAQRYFADLGHDTEAILARSDLYPRAGKNQHAFETAITRDGDVRVMLNLEPTERWLQTTLHELGHAVYDEAIDHSLPWGLRTPAHTFTTEAIAMLHGRRGRDPVFLTRYAGLDPAVAGHGANQRVRRRGLLVFNAFVQVMTRFERALYADPDQDLSGVWWGLVERYQLITRPDTVAEHDWAAKIHLAVAPVYYHNYLLGEALASQLEAMLEHHTGAASPAAHPAQAGSVLTERLLRPGASLRWDELVASATGEPFRPDHLSRALTAAGG